MTTDQLSAEARKGIEALINRWSRLDGEWLRTLVGGIGEVQSMLQRLPQDVMQRLRKDRTMGLSQWASDLRVDRAEGHSFLTRGLVEDATVVDLGLHRGHFARHIIERYGCRVVGVEPAPALYECLPRLERLVAEPYAVSAASGQARLHVNEESCATLVDGLAERNAPAVSVTAITLGEFVAGQGIKRAALMKVDIEGAEIDVLATASVRTLKQMDQISVEFHDCRASRLAPGLLAVDHRLHGAGFRRMAFSLDNTNVLYVNKSRVSLPLWARVYVFVRWKYMEGLVRRAGRLLRAWRRASSKAADSML